MAIISDVMYWKCPHVGRWFKKSPEHSYVIVKWSLKACSDCYNSVSACLELETKLSKRGG